MCSISQYFVLVNLVSECGGNTKSDAFDRAWVKVTSLKCRTLCNWKGKARSGVRKHGMEKSIVTKAIFGNWWSLCAFPISLIICIFFVSSWSEVARPIQECNWGNTGTRNKEIIRPRPWAISISKFAQRPCCGWRCWRSCYWRRR